MAKAEKVLFTPPGKVSRFSDYHVAAWSLGNRVPREPGLGDAVAQTLSTSRKDKRENLGTRVESAVLLLLRGKQGQRP